MSARMFVSGARNGRRCCSRLLSIVIGFMWTTASFAQLPTARLDTLWPLAATKGTTVEFIADGGEFIDEADRLFLSNPACTWEVLTDDPRIGESERRPRYGHFRLNLPEDAALGSMEVRLLGRYGVSNPRRFWITDLPTIVASAPRGSSEQAFSIQQPVAIQGRCSPEQMDHYRLSLQAGDLLSLQVRALQIDSAASITVVVRDPQGNEVHRVRSTKDDDAATRWSVPADGEYVIQVHDFLFRGGNPFFYVLEVRSLGKQSESANQQLVASTKNASLNAANAQPSRLTFPADLQVPVDPSGAPQMFDIGLSPGRPIAIDVDADVRGAATDLQMVVERVIPAEDGTVRTEKLVEVDDEVQLNGSLLQQRSSDPYWYFTPPAAGDYRVTLRDLQTAGQAYGPKQFRLQVRAARPAFELFAISPHASMLLPQSTHHGCLLRRGQWQAIEVGIVTNDGFFENQKGEIEVVPGLVKVPYDIQWTWPVEVSLAGLPAGVTATTVQLDRDHRRGMILLHAADDAAAWAGPLQVQAIVKSDQSQLEQQADIKEIRAGDPQGRGLLPIAATDAIYLAVTDLESMPLSVKIGNDTVTAGEVKRGAPLKLPVTITRAESATGKVTLRAVGLPADTSVPELALEGANLQGEVQLNCGANAPLGKFQFVLNAEIDLPWPRNPQVLERERQYLARLQEMLASADEATKPGLEQAVQQTTERIKQLEEATKAQNAKAYVLSNPLEVTINVP